MTNHPGLGETSLPRIIHYVWLGGKPFGPLEKLCLESWQKHLPSWEIRRWDEGNAEMDHPFVSRMMARGLVAFASDQIRLAALHEHGGLYLDTDMEICGPLEPLLNASCVTGFLSQQNRVSKNSVALGLLAAHPRHPWIGELLGRYDRLEKAVMNTSLATASLQAKGLRGMRQSPPSADFVLLEGIKSYHSDYCYPPKIEDRWVDQARTEARHHGTAAWGGSADPLPWSRRILDLRLDRKILRPLEHWFRRVRKPSPSP